MRTQVGERMVLQILSADIPYADIAFFVILVLGLVLGIIRGFAKSFKGFFLTIGIMLAALLILSPTFEKVRQIEAFGQMEESITSSFEEQSEVFSQPIYIETDPETGELVYYIDVTVEGEGTVRKSLQECVDEGGVSSLKAQFALYLAQTFITEDGTTIGSVAGTFVTDLVVAIIAYIVYCIVLGLLCWLLRKIFAKIHKSDNVLLKALDRTCGAIVSTAFAAIFILLALAILYSLRDKIPVVDEALSSSTVCGYFYLNNPVSKLFTEIFG